VAQYDGDEPVSGFEGKYFSMPCRNIVPKPLQSASAGLDRLLHRETINSRPGSASAALTLPFVDTSERSNGSTTITHL